MSNTEALRQISKDVLALSGIELVTFRKREGSYPVVGEGPCNPDIVFIGEAPGKNEARTGKPFCGAAGKILDELLHRVSLKREDVYVTNIVKDRPPRNRDPRPEEIALYGPFLDRQLEILDPKVIVTLGRFSMKYIMTRVGLEDKIEPISIAHGKVYRSQNIDIIPLYHPAAALYNRKLIPVLEKDIVLLKKYLKRA